jgi:glycine cleavage system aminomethyltransferase T
MLREDGFLFDDGTVARLADRHYVITTTTANAGRVMQHLEFVRQVLRPELSVAIASVSEQWAQFSIAGPRTLEVIERVVDGGPAVDFTAALPPLGYLPATVGGSIEARLFRVSYSGEKAVEIAAQSNYGDALIRRIMRVGEPFGIAPYGTEALNVLRIEKGHVGGNEMNGTTTAADLGLAGLVSRRKDFIGRIMAARPGLLAADRWALAGFRPVDPDRKLHAGAHFVPLGGKPSADDDQGYMTSVAYSPTLRTWIGLGLISRGRERHGERVRAYDPLRGNDVVVEICPPVFHDPEGGRQRD